MTKCQNQTNLTVKELVSLGAIELSHYGEGSNSQKQNRADKSRNPKQFNHKRQTCRKHVHAGNKDNLARSRYWGGVYIHRDRWSKSRSGAITVAGNKTDIKHKLQNKTGSTYEHTDLLHPIMEGIHFFLSLPLFNRKANWRSEISFTKSKLCKTLTWYTNDSYSSRVASQEKQQHSSFTAFFIILLWIYRNVFVFWNTMQHETASGSSV